MGSDQALHIFIGHDSREAVASEVASHSIIRRTQYPLNIKYLKHRELRNAGMFARPWLVNGETGNFTDLIDGRPFSTEFSHTRFLVPALMNYQGWALFMDADMIFLSDVQNLFNLCDNRYAAMVVKHTHVPSEAIKMDGREQLKYHRKNWSSFILWNCGHPDNRGLTPERVNFMRGGDLHRFSWLTDAAIGDLPFTYNYISGVSPKLPPERGGRPDLIHYTDGGPWFDTCKDVPYASLWMEEYEDMQNNGDSQMVSEVPTMAYEKPERLKK